MGNTTFKVCTVRLCGKPVYDGSRGPKDFTEGDTTLCQEHYYEWLTVHDIILDETGTPIRVLREVGTIDDDEIREDARIDNPSNYNQDIPWMRKQGDTPWQE